MSTKNNKFFGSLPKTNEEVTLGGEVPEEVVSELIETPVELESSEIEETTLPPEEVVEAEPDTQVETKFTDKAIGVWRQAPNRYNLIEIEYNPVTGETSNVKVLEEYATDRTTINEAFKITVVRSGVLG